MERPNCSECKKEVIGAQYYTAKGLLCTHCMEGYWIATDGSRHKTYEDKWRHNNKQNHGS